MLLTGRIKTKIKIKIKKKYRTKTKTKTKRRQDKPSCAYWKVGRVVVGCAIVRSLGERGGS